MTKQAFANLVAGTADAAFVVDSSGAVLAWNQGAAELFGVAVEKALHSDCAAILHGVDECGSICSPQCLVKQAILKRRAVRNFDMQVKTSGGILWCNVTTILLTQSDGRVNAMLVLRPIELPKRMELLLRDFVSSQGRRSTTRGRISLTLPRNAGRAALLTAREVEVLHQLAKDTSTVRIAAKMRISRTTINNHIQHILRKLDAHTRFEALRRAEAAGLL